MWPYLNYVITHISVLERGLASLQGHSLGAQWTPPPPPPHCLDQFNAPLLNLFSVMTHRFGLSGRRDLADDVWLIRGPL